jgi:hypothetical protein
MRDCVVAGTARDRRDTMRKLMAGDERSPTRPEQARRRTMTVIGVIATVYDHADPKHADIRVVFGREPDMRAHTAQSCPC